MGDRGDMEDGIALEGAVIAQKLAKGTLGLHMAALVQIALDHIFGVGGHADVVGHAFDHRQRRGAQGRHKPQLIHGHPHHGGHVVDGMRAHHEGHRKGTILHIGFIDRAEIAGRDQINPRLARAAQHQATNARIGHAGAGIDDEIDARRNIGRAIGAMLQMGGQAREIGLLAAQHHLLNRGAGGVHFNDLWREAQAPLHLLAHLVGRHAKGHGEPRAAATDIGDQLLRIYADAGHMHGLRLFVDHLRQIHEIAGDVMGEQFACRAQGFNETTQTEAFEIVV